MLSVVPLLLIYTLFGVWINWGSTFELRNGADVLIRRFFYFMGSWGEVGYILSLNMMVFGVVIYYRKLFAKSLNPSVLTGIVIEGAIWSFVLLSGLHFAGEFLLSFPNGFSMVEQFYLSVGAGVYEEFLFRFCLLSVCKLTLFKVLGFTPVLSLILALILSSIAFSGIHYMGELGDSFTMNSFLFRTFAGVLLGSIFVSRGFGIAAYSHFFYDILVTGL